MIALVLLSSNVVADEDCTSLRDRFAEYQNFAASNGVQAIFSRFMTQSMQSELDDFMNEYQIADDTELAGIDYSLRFPVHEKNVSVSKLECGPNRGHVLISSHSRGFAKKILFRFERELDEWKVASVEHFDLKEIEQPGEF